MEELIQLGQGRAEPPWGAVGMGAQAGLNWALRLGCGWGPGGAGDRLPCLGHQDAEVQDERVPSQTCLWAWLEAAGGGWR